MDQTQPNETSVDFSESIQRVLRACKRGRWLIALTTVLSVVGGNVGVHFISPKYRSEATILIAEQQFAQYIVTPLSTVPLIERLQVAEHDVLSKPQLLKIFYQVGLVAGNDLSPDDAVENQRKNIDLEPAPAESAFVISFTAQTPQLAQDVTKRLTALFIERHLEMQADRAQTATSLIEGQLADRRKKLSELEQRTAAFRAQYAGELSEDRPDKLEDLRQARSRLDSATASRDRAKEQRAVLESTLVRSLNARLTRVKDERAALLKNLTTKHPDVVSKDQQISQMEAEIEEIKTGVGTVQSHPSHQASVDPTIVLLEGQLEANALEIDNQSREAARQTAIVEEYQRRLNKNPLHEQQLNTMVQETNQLNVEIADLTNKQQQSGFATDLQAREELQEFRLVNPPNLPTHPANRKRQTYSLAALVAGPVLGLVLAFLLELRRPTFQNENELRRTFAPPLVLSIPLLPTPRERRARAWRTTFELVVGCILVIVIAGTEFYAYSLLA